MEILAKSCNFGRCNNLNKTMRPITKYWKALLSLLLAVAVTVFWALPYVSILCYQEQYQMFLWDGDYFLERILLPGGFADYVSEFLVQFNYVPVVGAMLVALVMVGIQRAVWALMRQMGEKEPFPAYLLSFVPSISLWVAMSDANVLLSFGVALLGVLWMVRLHLALRHRRLVMVVSWVVDVALGYWLLGPMVFIYVTLLVANMICDGVRQQCVMASVGHAACMFVFTIAWILLTTHTLQYPLLRFFVGLNYYRYPDAMPWQLGMVALLSVIIPLLGMVRIKAQRLLRKQKSKVVVALTYLLVIGVSAWCIRNSFTSLSNELIEYDFLVRTEQWHKIITKAERNQPTTPMGVSCVNLALSQTGQLADRLFEFYQNGGEGLFPTFSRDMTSPVPTAEVFFRLGMVNDAERYMFEAQEAIPNYRKSSRLTRRIAECELINGNYKVAAKLLRRLKKTLFYRHWATQTMALLDKEKAINAHPVYGKLRKSREKKQDFLFSDREMDQMLGFLFLNDNSNKMAYEYLMCYELLQRNMDKFMQYYPLGRFVGYDHIPRAFQEILVGNWMRTHQDPRTMPYSVDAQTVNNTLDFIQLYSGNPQDPRLSQQPYVTNAWHYMYIQK